MSEFRMHRLIAIALVLLILATFVAPATTASVAPPTAACCRASGLHHCSAPATGGTQVRGQACPYRKPLTFSSSAAPAPVAQPVAPAETHPFLHEFYPELFVSPPDHHNSQRAPPEASMK